MSEDGLTGIDSLSIAVFPGTPAAISAAKVWRDVLGSEAEKVEGFPARGTETALGLMGEYGLAIIQTAVSVQFVVGAPGATPPPPGISGPSVYPFEQLLEVALPIVRKFIEGCPVVARIGVHARRVYTFESREVANARALELIGFQSDTANLADLAVQLNRPSSVRVEDFDLPINVLTRLAVLNLVSTEFLFSELAGATAPQEQKISWQMLLSLDCNNAPSNMVFTEDTRLNVLDSLVATVRGHAA